MDASTIRVVVISADAGFRQTVSDAITAAPAFSATPCSLAIEIATPFQQISPKWLKNLRDVAPRVVLIDAATYGTHAAELAASVRRICPEARVADYLRAPIGKDEVLEVLFGKSQTTEATMAASFVIHDANARVEGRFETKETIEVSCEVKGEIIAGTLIVAESGNIVGNVQVADAVIGGRFEGDLVATSSLEVGPTGMVVGTIYTDGLTIKRGARFLGHVKPLSTYAQQPERRVSEPLIAVAVEGAAD